MPSLYDQRVQKARKIVQDSLPKDSLLQTPVPSTQLNVLDVPRSCGLLTRWETSITEDYDATELIAMLATQKITAVELLKAFRRRASIAHQVTNCLTELVPDALEWAANADAYIQKTGKPIGPLHGLPVSCKEQIGFAGRCTNASFVAWVDNVVEEDAQVVASLKALGAIPFARTTQPQSFMHLETSSCVYGVTVNPRNRTLTPGGSTGGEGALLCMKGSPLGIGGDIGGSIRGPAALNGLWGFKPSSGRYSGRGVTVPCPGVDNIQGTLGPMARTRRDLELIQRAYSSAMPWLDDPRVLPYAVYGALAVPRDRDRRLRVGIMATDDIVKPLPPVQLVMAEVSQRLSRSGEVELKEFRPWRHDKAWSIIAANYFEDGGARIRHLCAEGNEPVLPLTDFILEECQRNESLVKGRSNTSACRVARDAFREAYQAHWQAAGVDVVIAPVTPGTAPLLGTSKYWGYTAVWNLLDYPCVAFPASDMIGGYSRSLANMDYQPGNAIEAELLKHYDANVAQDFPVGLQVIAPRWMDSECLAATEVVERGLCEWG